MSESRRGVERCDHAACLTKFCPCCGEAMPGDLSPRNELLRYARQQLRIHQRNLDGLQGDVLHRWWSKRAALVARWERWVKWLGEEEAKP